MGSREGDDGQEEGVQSEIRAKNRMRNFQINKAFARWLAGRLAEEYDARRLRCDGCLLVDAGRSRKYVRASAGRD